MNRQKDHSIFFLLGILVIIFLGSSGYGQEAEKIQRGEQDLNREEELRRRIQFVPRPSLIETEKESSSSLPTASPGEKIYVRSVVVKGVTVFSRQDIVGIVSKFEQKDLSFGHIRELAENITEVYRERGYINSRAYIPPQTIADGILTVQVVEANIADIRVEGNRYFKPFLYIKELALKKGDILNYFHLKRGLRRINSHPDRLARIVVSPGEEPGSTDLLIKVSERFPFHSGWGWDNFGSRYVHQDRYKTVLTHNNVTGHGDILSFQYLLTQANTMAFTYLSYVFPLCNDLRVGFFTGRTKVDLADEYKALEVRGKSKVYSVYAIQSLLNEERVHVDLNVGFDYTDVFNFQLGQESGRDRMRVVRIGIDADFTDQQGRTIFTDEINFGVPNIMGGLRAKDDRASRAGSGGRFVKKDISLLRLQKMPKDSFLFLKNQFQFSPYTLTASEQFQIGGIANLRGYSPAEEVGDRGYSSSVEWSFPAYGLSPKIQVPFSRATLHEALRFAVFYDWANVTLNNPQADEEKSTTLRSVGCGFRVTLPEDFFIRLDIGWPLDRTPRDDTHAHTWLQVIKNF
ncbi:MAG: ShlB/FhaC/HecB family hemolysin secretion/activation protein [Candidatus Omnitrophica bacterium]|nr:ShlB/FhaC/HecB family hemolysin secretion/activation protein [Candidatus Omnitrophota bacterium]